MTAVGDIAGGRGSAPPPGADRTGGTNAMRHLETAREEARR